ncbi:carbohydrate porin [Frigoriglobus tundricola]|uniref:OmpA-like transmembrane domain n=1 Tax=Frigoriglobus tundricola TaxID=2774151 RepID=A0A6M5YHP8_9BACT|nr:carbohydrate porin [Frigoriglobus tundricola]QJW92783.1 OmpA-like transmembrane domain [Frigoriglobus tundricola]
MVLYSGRTAVHWLVVCAVLGGFAAGARAQLGTGPPPGLPTGFPAGLPSVIPAGGGSQDSIGKKSPNPDEDLPKLPGNKNGNGAGGKDVNEGGGDKKDNDDKEKKEDRWKLLPGGWNFHAQTTLTPIFDAGFGAKYSGPNSLSPEAQRAGTISADLYLGAPLWRGAEFHADLLMWQGFGLSNAFGLEASPDSDAYKAGTVDPRFMFAHFFVRQTFGLGGEQEDVPDGFLTLPGTRDVSRLTVTAGRMSVMDIFDNNTYNHDAHTQFMSWSSTMLTWDFPADTIGGGGLPALHRWQGQPFG